MTEKFKIYLDKKRQINIKFEDKEYKISNRTAEAIRYELYRILDIQAQQMALDWKPTYTEEDL